MLGEDFQAALPEAMYVFPVDPAVELPPDWAEFAVQPEAPYASTRPRSPRTATTG